MKYAIIVLTVVIIMHDISIHRLNRKFEILYSFFDMTIRQLEEYASKQTEKKFTAYDSAKMSHNCIGLCDIKKKLNCKNESQQIIDCKQMERNK